MSDNTGKDDIIHHDSLLSTPTNYPNCEDDVSDLMDTVVPTMYVSKHTPVSVATSVNYGSKAKHQLVDNATASECFSVLVFQLCWCFVKKVQK